MVQVHYRPVLNPPTTSRVTGYDGAFSFGYSDTEENANAWDEFADMKVSVAEQVMPRRVGLRSVWIAVSLGSVWPGSASLAWDGQITLPVITGRSGVQPFGGHPGWLDLYAAGPANGVSARIGPESAFAVPPQDGARCLIATFDGIETPPVILPQWPLQAGDYSVPMTAIEYACMPPGYPETWDRDYKVRAHEYWQTFVARSRHLYGIMAFDGPKITWWGTS